MPKGLRNVSIRLAPEDLAGLDRAMSKLGGILPRLTIAREALRIGLAKIEAEGFQALANRAATKSTRGR